jgi:hypothetical protein
MAKTEAEITLEIFQSVQQSTDKQKRLKSSTFWHLFGIKSRKSTVIERVLGLLDAQGLKTSVKSGDTFGVEKDDDWIILSLVLPQPSTIPLHVSKVETPSSEWFNMIRSRKFESEREVEAYFITELLEKLGYGYDDIVIGYPVKMFKGVQKITAEADFAIFKDEGRDTKDVLLLIEAKKSDKGITFDHINQVQSYAKELYPAYYVISNGEQVIVFQFNGMLAPDDRILEFDRDMIEEKWNEFYGNICKEAALKRKEWLCEKLNK